MDLILENRVGLLVAVPDGVYSSVPLDFVLEKKVVDLFYDTERLRPQYTTRGLSVAYPSTTRTRCSRPSSERGTGASTGSEAPSRFRLDTPRQTPLGFSTSIR